MSSIVISIDEGKKGFLLTGNLDLIRKNRRAKYYLQDFLDARDNPEGILIPYRLEDRETVLKNIQEAFLEYNIPTVEAKEVVDVLHDYFREKENFKVFSAKARDIWYNKVDQADFKLFAKSLEINLPARRLYDKQMLGAFHLAFSQNACNFSVPGAGKTSIVYGAYAYLSHLPENDPKHVNKLLIIGPLSSFGPWELEFKECFGREVNSKRLSGGIVKEERDNHLLSIDPVDRTPELTLMSYQSVSYNLESLSYFLKRKGNKVMVVLDEAHKIKNVDGGVWSQSILSLSDFCRARVVLTGTPAPNGYEDIYNLYEFIWPKKDIIKFTTYQLKDMSSNRFDKRVSRLIDDISPFFIRIRKSDILNAEEFPINNVPPIVVEMGPVQKDIYEFLEDKYLSFFSEDENIQTVTEELTKARFIRLMQAATNPGLLKQPLENYFRDQGLTSDLNIDDSEVINKILNYREFEDVPSKFIKVREIVSSLLAKQQKVIIWATFIRNIKDLQEYLEQNGIKSKVLIGETPIERDDVGMDEVETRERIIRDFHRADSSFKVIIANPFAVAESISLHKACHNAIYLERTFNAANFIQSKDRIHRVGLTPGTVTSYHYILSKDSIDETIHRRLIEKEIRMLEIIESQEIPFISENMDYEIDLKDDVKAIIRDYVRRTARI